MHKKTLTLIALLAITCLYNEAVNAIALCTPTNEKTCRDMGEKCDEKSEKSFLACKKIWWSKDKKDQCLIKLNQEKRNCYKKCSCESMCPRQCDQDNKTALQLCNANTNTTEKDKCLFQYNKTIESCKKTCLGK